MPTYIGKESLSREKTIEAWKSMYIEKKSAVAVSLSMNCSTNTLYRAFHRWGLPVRRSKKDKK